MYYGFVYLILLVAFFSGVLVVEGDAGTTLSVFFEGSHAYVYAVFNGVNPGSSERVIGEVFQGYSFTVIESSGGFNTSTILVKIPLRGGVLRVNLGVLGNASVRISSPPYLSVSSTRDNGYIIISTSLKTHILLLGLLLLLLGLIAPPLVAYASSVLALTMMPRGGSVVDAIEVASIPSSLSTIFPALSLIASLFATRLFEALDYYGIPMVVSLLSYMALYLSSIVLSLAVASRVFGRVVGARVSLRDIILASQPLAYVVVSGSALVAGVALIASSAPQIILSFSNLPLPLSITLWVLVGFTISYALTTLIARLFDAITPKVKPDERLLKVVARVLSNLGHGGFRRIDVVRSSKPIAAIKGIFGDRLVVSNRLLEILDDEELEYVVAHEVVHSKERHLVAQIAAVIALWIASLTTVSTILLNILKTQQSILAVALTIAILALGTSIPIAGSLWISRKLEERADMKALAMMGGKAKDRKAYLRALAKIAVETGEAVKPRDNMIWKLANLCETHPRTLDRLVKTAKIIGISEKELEEIVMLAKNQESNPKPQAL
jgi:Zn-dependent protease with chaperone function